MKKALFFTVLSLLAVSSFAQDIPNRFIFIEGTAENAEHYDFFMRNFRMEADAAGYTVTGSKNEAAHTVFFNVVSNTITDSTVTDSEVEEQQVPPDDNQNVTDDDQNVIDDNQSVTNDNKNVVNDNRYVIDDNKYVIKVSLINNADDFEILFFDFFFTNLDEMYVHNRNMFQTATLYIPPFSGDDMIVVEALDNRWKNKWIYFRLSFDYPITIYKLKPDGLEANGTALYNVNDPNILTPIGSEIMAMPGLTAGLEFHILNIFSIELNFQMSMGDTRNMKFINMAVGAELKFPIKFKNTMLIPYGAFTYPLNKSEDVFAEFPLYAVGGGIQFCARGGKHGAFFVDVKYMLSFTDAVMHNPFLAYTDKYTPDPPVIHYQRSVIGIGIGYKIGFFNKKEKTRK